MKLCALLPVFVTRSLNRYPQPAPDPRIMYGQSVINNSLAPKATPNPSPNPTLTLPLP